MTECTMEHFVCEKNGPYCLAHSPDDAWVCTLAPGHSGNHIACVPVSEKEYNHNLAVWPQKKGTTETMADPSYLEINENRIKNMRELLDQIDFDLDDVKDNERQSRIDDELTEAEGYLIRALKKVNPATVNRRDRSKRSVSA